MQSILLNLLPPFGSVTGEEINSCRGTFTALIFCLQIYNLGTGKGYSVIEMAKAFEKASGKPVS